MAGDNECPWYSWPSSIARRALLHCLQVPSVNLGTMVLQALLQVPHGWPSRHLLQWVLCAKLLQSHLLQASSIMLSIGILTIMWFLLHLMLLGQALQRTYQDLLWHLLLQTLRNLHKVMNLQNLLAMQQMEWVTLGIAGGRQGEGLQFLSQMLLRFDMFPQSTN